MNSLIIDVIIVLIIAISAIFSAKRGFVRTLVEVIGGIFIIYCVISFSTPVADFIYSKTIEPSIVKSVEKSIEDSADNMTDKIWKGFPKIITNNAELFGISMDNLSDNIESTTGDTAQVAAGAANTVARPMIVRILSLLISIICTVLLLFLLRILARMLNSVFDFSVLGKINRTLGGILGIVKGLLVSVVFIIAVMFIISINKNGFLIFTNESIDNTYIFKNLYGVLPFRF